MQVKHVALTTDLLTSNQTLSSHSYLPLHQPRNAIMFKGPRNAVHEERPHCTKPCRKVEKDCRRMGDELRRSAALLQIMLLTL